MNITGMGRVSMLESRVAELEKVIKVSPTGEVVIDAISLEINGRARIRLNSHLIKISGMKVDIAVPESGHKMMGFGPGQVRLGEGKSLVARLGDNVDVRVYGSEGIISARGTITGGTSIPTTSA